MARVEFDQELERLETEIKIMASTVESAIEKSINSLLKQDMDLAKDVIKGDDVIDKMCGDIEDLCMSILRRQAPLASDLREIVSCMYVIEELERIGDYAEGIAVLTIKIGVRPLPTDLVIIPKMSIKTIEILRMSTDTFLIKDPKEVNSKYKTIRKQDDVIDDLNTDVRGRLIQLMKNKPHEIERATYLLWVAHNLERIADRGLNIAERSMQLVGN
ncbi:MAG: phosphate signaling complex protein PhoU [Chloroflexota bacterium]|jgi:phosphate transport system protein|nr:phosphate signaling complex protein PhoU [Chloroflexota bacterium]MEC9107147.1 phosphate signaling complex protein PhoU [Chloroflexota bacterium]MQG24482.1 phosphate signaling complex protein PhoU [SAR202 cluster bacterium]|tara:strand:+ start:137 stop:784 length:648 start_codon:yes stop_codon:yes gene_type:complete